MKLEAVNQLISQIGHFYVFLWPVMTEFAIACLKVVLFAFLVVFCSENTYNHDELMFLVLVTVRVESPVNSFVRNY